VRNVRQPARRSIRLAAGTLVLALPLAAAAGCGEQKRRTIAAELAAAQANLAHSRATSVTLRLGDDRSNLSKLAQKDGNLPKDLAPEVLGGSITITMDPASDKELRDLHHGSGTSSADLSARLKDVNAAVVLRDQKHVVGELRLVAGVLYARVAFDEVSRLAKAGGVSDFDSQLSDAQDSAPRQYRQAITDLRAGKWLKVDLAKYVDQLTQLAGSVRPGPTEGKGGTPSRSEVTSLGNQLFAAVKPYVKVTDANDSSADRVLDVRVQARAATKAALKVLKASKALPFGSALAEVDGSVIDKTLSEGTAHGTITMRNGHLSQVTVDLESIRTLDRSPGKDSLVGTTLILDVDDAADEVRAPTDVSSFDIGALLDEVLSSFSGEGAAGSSSSLEG
jgi:hypothetical protein